MNHTRRRFSEKGYQDENDITPEKICYVNQFQSLTEEEKEHILEHNNNITSNNTQIMNKKGKGIERHILRIGFLGHLITS